MPPGVLLEVDTVSWEVAGLPLPSVTEGGLRKQLGGGVLVEFAPGLRVICASVAETSAAITNTQANDLRNCANKVLPEMSTIDRFGFASGRNEVRGN